MIKLGLVYELVDSANFLSRHRHGRSVYSLPVSRLEMA